LSVLNAAVYLFVFVRPFNLLALYGRPLLDLKQVSVFDPAARWRLLAGFALLALFYCLGWRTARRAQSCQPRIAWALVLAGAAASAAVLLFLYPFGAADLFDNIMHGRILAVYGGNPFEQVSAGFRGDPFYPYVGWRRFPSAYGPGWELLAAATARLAGDGILANVLAFKALGGVCLAGCVALVAGVLRRAAPERALAGVLLLAWNPLVLFETLGQGHNDVAMLFFVLACVACLARGRHTLAALSLVAGTLVKFVPLLLLPTAGLISLRALPHTKARLRYAALTLAASLVLVLATFAPFWYGPETLDVERRGRLYTASLPAVAYAFLAPRLGVQQASAAVSRAAAALTLAFALWQALRASRRPGWQSFAQAAFAILTFYLLCTCLWFQQWYVISPLGLVPLLPAGSLAGAGVFFSLVVLAKPLVFEPLWLWPNPNPDRSWLELRLGPATLALPWLATVLAAWRDRRSTPAVKRRGVSQTPRL
jgi:hypothetical protein